MSTTVLLLLYTLWQLSYQTLVQCSVNQERTIFQGLETSMRFTHVFVSVKSDVENCLVLLY